MRTQIIRAFRPIWFRGKGRLFNAIFPHHGVYKETIHGATFELDLKDHIQRNVFLGAYEPKETTYLKSLLKPGMTFVDIGANIGYFSALASSLVGENGKVFSFEPSPYAFAKLKKMADSTPFQNIRTYPIALSDTPGQLKLPVPQEGNHTPSFLDKTNSNQVSVDVQRLDVCLSSEKISEIDLLKIDVEGFELKALKGAENLFKSRKIKNIICEFNEYWLREAGTSSNELLQFLMDNDFDLRSPKPNFRPHGVENLYFHLKSKEKF